MAKDPYAASSSPVTRAPSAKQVQAGVSLAGDQLTNVQKGINIQTDTATAPYAGPKAKADLTNTQLTMLRDINTNARDELKTFEGLEIVKTYDQGML